MLFYAVVFYIKNQPDVQQMVVSCIRCVGGVKICGGAVLYALKKA